MFITFILRSCLVFIVFFSAFSAQAQDKQDLEIYDDWRLVKDDKGVQVYVRWKEAEPGRKARQLRCEMIIQSSLSAVVATIKDDKEMFRWVNRLKTYYSFNITGDFEWDAYSEFQIPWPLDNQDLVTRIHFSQEKITRAIYLDIRDNPGKIPIKKDVDRIPRFEGSWDIIPMDKGMVKIVYKIFTGQKPFLPRWIIDPVIQYGMWKTLMDMQTVIDEKNKSKVRLGFIVE